MIEEKIEMWNKFAYALLFVAGLDRKKEQFDCRQEKIKICKRISFQIILCSFFEDRNKKLFEYMLYFCI